MSSAKVVELPAEAAVKLDDEPSSLEHEPVMELDNHPNPLKRKSASETGSESESPKRTRTESDDAGPKYASPDGPSPATDLPKEHPGKSLAEARARVAQEEKRRGIRLFGGLLGTLKQRPANSLHWKRLEIETRQQERLRQQRTVEQKAMEEKRERLEETRLRESIKWEERVLHVRHSTLRDQAMFLRTKAQPPILYKPYIITADQKDRIRRQMRCAQDTIDQEREEFRGRRQKHERIYGPVALADEKRDDAERAGAEKLPEASKESGSGGHVREGPMEPRSAVDGDHHDESGDVVVESQEDVVIY